MTVHPRMTVHLDHQAKHLRSAPQQSFCVAAGVYGGLPARHDRAVAGGWAEWVKRILDHERG